MKKSGYLGILLLIASLLLTGLMVVDVPRVKVNDFSLPDPVAAYGDAELNNFYNLTVDPNEREGHRVEIVLSSYDSWMDLDFWAVNRTGLGILDAFLGLGQDIVGEDYPNGMGSFGLIETYAKEISVTRQRSFDLNLTGQNPYCLVLLNFQPETQNVSVTVKETYVESYSPIVEANYVTASFALGIAVVGVLVVVRSFRKPPRRIRRLNQKLRVSG